MNIESIFKKYKFCQNNTFTLFFVKTSHGEDSLQYIKRVNVKIKRQREPVFLALFFCGRALWEMPKHGYLLGKMLQVCSSIKINVIGLSFCVMVVGKLRTNLCKCCCLWLFCFNLYVLTTMSGEID